jgi:hypothetical protein
MSEGGKAKAKGVDYDLKTVAAHIDLGRHDGNLGDLFNALRRRMGEQLAGLPWRITVGKVSFTMDDMSPLALAEVEEITGASWLTLNPETSAVVFKAITVAHLVIDEGWPEADVIELLRKLRGSDLVAAISRDEVWPDPKATSPFGSKPKT